jgi:hypothetical protein
MPADDIKIANRVDIIGHNVADIRAYVLARRPDVVDHIERILSERGGRTDHNDALLFLLSIGYSAGRASVVAEVEQRPIADVCKRDNF